MNNKILITGGAGFIGFELYNLKTIFIEPGLIEKSWFWWQLPNKIKWHAASLINGGTKSIINGGTKSIINGGTKSIISLVIKNKS
jgi:hypothetical protein